MRVEYWVDARGHLPVFEYVEAAARSGDERLVAALARAVDALEAGGPALGMPLARLIDRRLRLYELRLGAHRIAYAQQGEVILLLHAWRKRTQKLDEREAATARRRLRRN